MELQPITNQPHNKVTTQNQKVVLKIKNKIQSEPVKTAAIGGSSLLLIIVGIIKRKTISNFVKKILKKTPQSLENAEKSSKSKTINKIELPKPNFTVGKENLEQYAKEKANYIQSIWEEYLYVNPPYKPMNKEKNILGLQALQKYGTREDLLKLHDVYQISKDSDIMKEYAKLVGKVGVTKDALPLRSKLTKKKITQYDEDTIAEIMKSLKKLMVEEAPPKYFENANYGEYMDLERLSTHKNPEISENAKAIMKRLSDENPWMLE